MILSPNYSFIFVHLYKCAGTSVEHALSQHLQYNDLLLGSTDNGQRAEFAWKPWIRLQKHSRAIDIRRFVGPEIWSSYRTFATVRNPYSFAVSQYQFCIDMIRAAKRAAGGSTDRAKSGAAEQYDESVWPWNYAGVRACMARQAEDTSFSQFLRAEEVLSWEGLAPMSDSLCDEHMDVIVDEIIRVEELNARWAGLCEWLGLPETALATRNESSARSRRLASYYSDPSDVAVVRDRFAIDFEHFGYDPGLVFGPGNPSGGNGTVAPN